MLMVPYYGVEEVPECHSRKGGTVVHEVLPHPQKMKIGHRAKAAKSGDWHAFSNCRKGEPVPVFRFFFMSFGERRKGGKPAACKGLDILRVRTRA